MTTERHPFDLRQNEDFIFSAQDTWWCSNRVLTTSGAVLLILIMVAGYASLMLGMVHAAQAWVRQ